MAIGSQPGRIFATSSPCMLPLRTFYRLSRVSFVFLLVGLAAGQDSTAASHPSDAAKPAFLSSASNPISFDDFVVSLVLRERSLTDLMRSFKPIVETYVQERGARPRFQAGLIPNGDDYFLGRLNLSGGLLSTVPFADEETYKRTEEYFVQDPVPFNQVAFEQALFPDFDHFDRQNYDFQFVRWEVLGEVHCAVVDVRPREKSKNRGFVGRIWVEDQNHSIVRFTGTFTKGFAQRAFHFESWRLNLQGTWWVPAYIYTQESSPHDSHHSLWFKAQTRVWGYDPRGPATSQDLKPTYAEGKATHSPEDIVLDRAQEAGLMAPDGDVDQILQTVVNNLLITNDLDITDVRCRVLLTTPLESFVMGRTIVLSRGLLDVLPDEATLAAVLAHELAHIVLGHAAHDVSTTYLAGFAWPFPDSQIFAALDFRFDRTEEKEANKKALELFLKSPYKDQLANVDRFLRALDANSARFPNLLHGRFSNDFGSGQLAGLQTGADSTKAPKKDRSYQIFALPLGSRFVVDPWSDEITMLKNKPLRPTSPGENIPFEVTPFYPHLKRLDAPGKPNGARQ